MNLDCRTNTIPTLALSLRERARPVLSVSKRWGYFSQQQNRISISAPPQSPTSKHIVITVHTEYQARFREITKITEESFQLEQPLVSELAERITQKYGSEMQALLIDPETNDLNAKGTLYLDSKGSRIFIDDTLADGETIVFMVGIAGG